MTQIEQSDDLITKAITAAWTCPSCKDVFNGVPPDHRLCGRCLGQLASAGYQPAPGAPYSDLPPCPDCGGQMVEVVTVGDVI